MRTGVDIDIVTLQPRFTDSIPVQGFASSQEESKLTAQIAEAREIHSPEGSLFVNMLVSRLESRVDALILTDPEAQSYVRLLKELGVKIALAKQAAQKIADRNMGKHAR